MAVVARSMFREAPHPQHAHRHAHHHCHGGKRRVLHRIQLYFKGVEGCQGWGPKVIGFEPLGRKGRQEIAAIAIDGGLIGGFRGVGLRGGIVSAGRCLKVGPGPPYGPERVYGPT